MEFLLRDSLNHLRNNELKSFATRFQIGKKITRNEDLINCLHDYLINETAKAIDFLSADEKLLLADIIYHGSSNSITFPFRYQKDFPLKGNHYERKSLVFAFIANQYYLDDLKIPTELKVRLKRLLPAPKVIELKTESELPEKVDIINKRSGEKVHERPLQIYESEPVVFHELKRVLSLAQAGKLRVSDKSRKPTASAVKAVNAVLVRPDFDLNPPEHEPFTANESGGNVRAYAWPILIQQANWCKAKAGKLILTKEGKEFIQTPTVENFYKGFECLCADDEFDEMHRINHIRGQTGKANSKMIFVDYRKNAICNSMSKWPVNQWISIDEAFRGVYMHSNGFMVIENALYLYFEEKMYGHLAGKEMEINKQYLRVFLFETLATFGLVDVAYVYPHKLWPELKGYWGTEQMDFCSRYDGLQYIRLNALGAYCLNMSEQYEPPEMDDPQTLKVLPNHEIIYVGKPENYDHAYHFLEMLAMREGDYKWIMDQRPILEYIEKGGTFQDIWDFLNKHSSTGIPEGVEIFLQDIEKKTGLFSEPEEALIFNVKDASTAKLIAHDSRTKRFCWLLETQKLVVKKKNFKSFQSALKKMGYLLT